MICSRPAVLAHLSKMDVPELGLWSCVTPLWFKLVGEDASASSRVRMVLSLWHVQGYRET